MYFLQQIKNQFFAGIALYTGPEGTEIIETPTPVEAPEGPEVSSPLDLAARTERTVLSLDTAVGEEGERFERLLLERGLDSAAIETVDTGNMYVSEEMRGDIEAHISEMDFEGMSPEERVEAIQNAYIERATELKIQQFDSLSIEDRQQILEGDETTPSVRSIINETAGGEIESELLARAIAQNLEGFEFDVDGQALTDEDGVLLVGDNLRTRIDEYAREMRERVEAYRRENPDIVIEDMESTELYDVIFAAGEDVPVPENITPPAEALAETPTGAPSPRVTPTGGPYGTTPPGPRAGFPDHAPLEHIGPGGADTNYDNYEVSADNLMINEGQSPGQEALAAMQLNSEAQERVDEIMQEGFFPILMSDESVIFVDNPSYDADTSTPKDGVSAREAQAYEQANADMQLVNFAEADAARQQAHVIGAMTGRDPENSLSILAAQQRLEGLQQAHPDRLIGGVGKIMGRNAAGEIGMVGGIRDISNPDRVWQASNETGRAHAQNPDYADYSQMVQMRHVEYLSGSGELLRA